MAEELAQRKLFIGGLSYATDDDKLRKYFCAYGVVQDAVVMKDALTRRSRGFGFITYIDIESLDKALDAAPHSIDGRKVEAKRAVPRADGSSGPIKPVVSSSSSSVVAATATSTSSSTATKSPNSSVSVSGSGSISSGSTGGSVSSGSLPTGLGAPTSYAQLLHDNSSGGSSSREPRLNMDEYAYIKVFVGGLHFDTRELEMRAYFSKYGKIVSAEVMINRETHKSRGFGFVVFEQERFAEAVCREKDHVIDSKIVEVKRAIPRSKMIALASGGGAEKPVPAAPTAPSSPSPASGSDTPKKTNTPSASVSHSPTSAASFAALAAKIGQPGAYRTAAAASALASNSAASASTTSSPATSTTSTISNNSGAAADTSTFTYAAALTSKLPLSSQGQTAFLGARSSNSSFDNTSFESDLLSLSSLGGEEPALSVGGLTLGAGLLGLERTDQHAGLYTRSTRSNSMRSDSFSSTVGSRSESGYETGVSSAWTDSVTLASASSPLSLPTANAMGAQVQGQDQSMSGFGVGPIESGMSSLQGGLGMGLIMNSSGGLLASQPPSFQHWQQGAFACPSPALMMQQLQYQQHQQQQQHQQHLMQMQMQQKQMQMQQMQQMQHLMQSAPSPPRQQWPHSQLGSLGQVGQQQFPSVAPLGPGPFDQHAFGNCPPAAPAQQSSCNPRSPWQPNGLGLGLGLGGPSGW